MIYIEIAEAYADEVEPAVLSRAAQVTLDNQASLPEVDLSVIITHDEQLRQLNLQFLDIDSPTDVLSFPAGYMDPDTNRLYLGDILISLPTALAQSITAAHPLETELQLLVVHGTLHLLGHDHLDPAEKSRMWSIQNEILSLLGINLA